MVRSTTTGSLIDDAKALRAEKFRLKLDHRADDKSRASLRKRRFYAEGWTVKRWERIRGGLPYEWLDGLDELDELDFDVQAPKPVRTKMPPRGAFARTPDQRSQRANWGPTPRRCRDQFCGCRGGNNPFAAAVTKPVAMYN